MSKILVLLQVLFLVAVSMNACKKNKNDDSGNLLMAALLVQNAAVAGGASACGQNAAYVKASNTDIGDAFGYSVDVDDGVMVVGAPEEDSSAKTVNGDGNNESEISSGAAYVYVCENNAWRFDAYLKAPNSEMNDRFGSRVAVSGNTVVVSTLYEASVAQGVNGDGNVNGAVQSGAAYVFVREGGTWKLQAYLKSENSGSSDFFGTDVDIDGDLIVVGAPGEDSIWAYINAPDGSGSESSGAAYVFRRNENTWTQEAYIKAINNDRMDKFGTSVAISGTSIVVGAINEQSIARGVYGPDYVVSMDDDNRDGAGAAYVYIHNGIEWQLEAYLKASNTDAGDQFGSDVSISGDTIVVASIEEAGSATGVNGAQDNNSMARSGAAYVYVRNGTTWSQQAYLKAGNTGADDRFGTSVAVYGDLIAVGAYREGGEGDALQWSGAVYVYKRQAEVWNLEQYQKAPNADIGDYYGQSVAIFGTSVLVGAYHEESKATEINGSQTNDAYDNAGAGYLFNF